MWQFEHTQLPVSQPGVFVCPFPLSPSHSENTNLVGDRHELPTNTFCLLQVQDYHGHKISDPYAWLEDPDSEQTKVIGAYNEFRQALVASTKLSTLVTRAIPSCTFCCGVVGG